MKTTWILIHGGWGGSWQWSPLEKQLRDKGIVSIAPEMPGMGQTDVSRITLSNYINHISTIIDGIDGQVNIAAFSFGGMTATAIAGKYSEKIQKLIYIDAFVPNPGQSFSSIAGEKITRQINAYAHVMGENHMIPPFFEIDPRYRPHPLHTLFSIVQYRSEILDLIKPVYIECTAKDPQWAFTPLLNKMAAKVRERKWDCYELDSDHMPMFSHTDKLFTLLTETMYPQN